MPPKCEACAGGIVLDDERRLLVVRRGKPPSMGRWTIPGGRCRRGESRRDACIREVAEETGLVVDVLHSAGRVMRDGPPGVVYDIEDFVCAVRGGELRAGDDAAEARWVTGAELADLNLTPGLVGALAGWGVLPS
jgi:8-oxo-dGTP diphosphatase